MYESIQCFRNNYDAQKKTRLYDGVFKFRQAGYSAFYY